MTINVGSGRQVTCCETEVFMNLQSSSLHFQLINLVIAIYQAYHQKSAFLVVSNSHRVYLLIIFLLPPTWWTVTYCLIHVIFFCSLFFLKQIDSFFFLQFLTNLFQELLLFLDGLPQLFSFLFWQLVLSALLSPLLSLNLKCQRTGICNLDEVSVKLLQLLHPTTHSIQPLI